MLGKHYCYNILNSHCSVLLCNSGRQRCLRLVVNVEGPFMSREIPPASRAERPSEIGPIEGLGSQVRRAERQRGRWNFLTWSFFLAEVAAGVQFFGTGAKAAQADDAAARSKAHFEATGATHDGALDNPGTGVAAADDGGGGAAAPQTVAHSAQTGLELLSLQHGEEIGAPLSNNDGGFTDASSSGSGTSGAGSSQADSGGSSATPDYPPCGILPPISNGPPLLPPISPPFGVVPPISDGPHSGVFPPISDSPPTGVLPPISVGETVSHLLDTTLDQLTGLHLIETVGGLLGDTVGDTLGQLTGLVGNAGDLTAVVDGLLGSSLTVALSATDFIIPQAAEVVASSLGTLAATATDLGLLGDIGHLSADGTVSQIVYTTSSQLVEDAGNILNALPGDLTDALNTSDMAPPVLNIVSDVPEMAPLAHDQDVPSGGTISFPDLTSVNVLQVDDLFAGGRYTDYGLAVQSDVNPSPTAIADTLSGDTDNSTLNSAIDSPTDGHESALSPGEQDVNASSVSLPSIIEELGVRDHSI
jgi:hypothetical protein